MALETNGTRILGTTYLLNYTDDQEDIIALAKEIMEDYPEDSPHVIGVDIETTGLSPHDAEISTVQLYLPVINEAVCLHVRDNIPDELKELLTTRKLVAHNANFELKFFLSRGVEPQNLNCSMLLYKLYNKALKVEGGGMSGSLEAAMDILFKFKTDKTQQTSSWGAATLTKEQKYYAAIDAILTWLVFDKTYSLTIKNEVEDILEFYSINKKAMKGIARMSEKGVKLDKLAHGVMVMGWQLDEQKALVAVNEHIPEDVNLRSGKQFDGWLKETFTQGDLKKWPVSPKTGYYKKDKLTIQQFSHLEGVGVLEDYNKVQKLLSTYGPSLNNLVSPVTGRIHCSYWQCHTHTGRLSCSGPNMQQQVRGETRKIFIAEDGMKMVCADYSQVEVRVLAHIANEREMLNEYKKGEKADFYKLVASKLLGISIARVNADQRQLAKAVVLGKLYGMGAEKLMNQATYQFGIAMTLEQAKEFLWTFEEGFPSYRKWKKKVVSQAEKTLRVTAVGGCSRKLEEDRTYNISLNHPIQSCAAVVNLRALTRVDEEINKFGSDKARIILSVHDEIVVECIDKLADKCKGILEKEMVGAFLEYFPTATTTGLVEAKIAKDWYGAK